MRQPKSSRLLACLIVIPALLVPGAGLKAQFNDVQTFDGTVGSIFSASYWTIDGGCSGAVVFRDTKRGDEGSKCLRSLHPVGVGTRMIRDLNPGPGSSIVGRMAVSGIEEVVRLWISADDGSGTVGQELYRVQGALYPVTSVEMDINPGLTGSNPANLFRQEPGEQGNVYFSADDGVNGRELWLCHTTTGFVTTTFLLADINAGPGSSDPGGFAVVGNNMMKGVVFAATDATHGRELWFSDGITTTLLKDINVSSADASSEPQLLNTLLISWPWSGPYDAKVFFTADDGVHGRELWRTDGTVAGTGLVKDILAGPTGSNPTNLLPVKLYAGSQLSPSVLFTVNSDGVNGEELWKTGGALDGSDTVMVYDPGPAGSPANLITAGTLYKGFFTVGNSLWRTDGTAGGTYIVKTFSSPPSNFVAVGDKFYFTADDGTGKGVELWVSAGTSSYTKLVKDINPGTAGSLPANLTAAGSNLLYFSAIDGTHGRELWKSSVSSDWLTFPTSMVQDINPGAAGSDPADLTAFDGTLIFTVDDGTHGRELWQTDGFAVPNYSGMSYKWDLSSLIQSKGDPARIAVAGTDEAPLSVYLLYDFPAMGGQDFGMSEAAHQVNTYVELADGTDRAPLSVTYVDCGDGNLPRPQAARTDGSNHNAIAFGMVAVLDQNPCDTDPRGGGSPGVPFAYVPAVYDGRDWIPMDLAHIPAGVPTDPPSGASLAQGPYSGFLARDASLSTGLYPATIDPWTTKRFCHTRIDVWTHCVRVTWASKQLGVLWIATVPRRYHGVFQSLYLGNRACVQPAYPLYLDTLQLNGGLFTTSLEPYGACCNHDTGVCISTGTVQECDGLGGEFHLFRMCGDIDCYRNPPIPFADADRDHDVDQSDFATFQACFTGESGGILNPDCGLFDRDDGGVGDGDIDRDDLLAFEDCATGPGVPFDPNHPGDCVP